VGSQVLAPGAAVAQVMMLAQMPQPLFGPEPQTDSFDLPKLVRKKREVLAKTSTEQKGI
jgi:hypothetical protein